MRPGQLLMCIKEENWCADRITNRCMHRVSRGQLIMYLGKTTIMLGEEHPGCMFMCGDTKIYILEDFVMGGTTKYFREFFEEV